MKIVPDDFAGNIQRAGEFELHRDINKIGKPVDRGEWEMSPATVNAYYSAQMNDINFPAGVLQPPLYDPKMDDAPNYGDTGGTIGHELTHGFDDRGQPVRRHREICKNWWTKEDREKFDTRTKCVADQYAQYVMVDDIHVNGELTLGENVADLGGEILAFMAWKDATKDKTLHPIDGLTPEQRFFVGFAQWDCANDARRKPARASYDRSAFSAAVSHQRRGGQYAGICARLLVQSGAAHGESARESLQGLVSAAAGLRLRLPSFRK